MEKNKSGIYLAIPEAVVVGNGEFPSHPFPLSVLDQAPCVVCCDGGANALVESGRLPDWIVGDGDSLSEENRIRFQDRIHRIPDQETNDQTKAVSFLDFAGHTSHCHLWEQQVNGKIIRWAISVCLWSISRWGWKW